MAFRLLAAGVLSAVAFVLWAITAPPNEQQPAPSSADETYTVTRVLDGDTIVVNNGMKVRYIGIDTPEFYSDSRESDCFAREAKKRNEELVLGKEVRLVRDVSETDKYNRLLRYVYRASDATNETESINEQLVRDGFALARTFPPDVAMSAHLQSLEKEAHKSSRGLWSACK